MILIHKVIEILRVTDDDGGLVNPVVAFYRGHIATPLVDGDLFREPPPANGLA